MNSRKRTHRKPRRKGRGKWLLALIVIIAGAYWFASEVLPNREHIDPDWKGTYNKPIFAKGEILEGTAIGEGDGLKLPLPVIQSVVDPNIRYEQDTKSVILTTPKKLVLLKTDEKTGKINNKPVNLRFAPEEQDGVLYLPADLLEDLYGMEVHEDSASGAVLLMEPGESLEHVTVRDSSRKKNFTVPLRVGKSIHTPILTDMKPGTKLRILETLDEWYYVQLYNGYTGFVKKQDTVPGGSRVVPELAPVLSPGKEKWQSKKINMTWEAVYEVAPKPASIGKLPGVNVVSPTWFSLVDGSGNVRSKADQAYVKWAHDQGMQVWGLFSNSFDPDLTTEALSTFENRMTTILQMLHYAKLYDLDGINIDYENVYTEDGPNLTQFMRELRPLALEYGLVVSIDVTPKSNSEMWSAFLDRRALSNTVDYLILMAYDEHWASSPTAGSVASLPWTSSSATRILEEDGVSPDQLILAVPLYTRVWTETEKDGQTEVKSKAIGMEKAQSIIKEKKLSPKLSEETGQNYVEYEEDGALNRIWLEDAESLGRRVELAKSLGLAGIASWNRSFASAEAWETLKGIAE
ncbi:glycosyl hydrolase family 18 protein [Paenibacillus sp. M1]|uniref:Glycosyl hydrolase family 18 protein n=1 Tax=Paenibacillus haidiansis TaxID=1574488 RepID=A0ABU7VZV8_9BACL